MQEGGTKAVLLSGSDIDEDALTYSVTQGTNITSSIDGSTITFSVSDDNWNGTESFTATVTDGEFSSDQTFAVTVEGVNDAPVLATVLDVSFDEDASGSVSLSASDIDGDDSVSYTHLTLPTNREV